MPRRLSRFWLFILFLLPFAAALGQSPRKVLIEEFTNASSPNAFKQDNIYSRYIGDSRLLDYAVPIIYHTNFPGRDSVFEALPGLNASRTQFYGVGGIPRVYVNGEMAPPTGGHVFGEASDTAAISARISSIREGMSPITITIENRSSGSDLAWSVKVSSIAPIAGARLHLVAVEMSAYYANAGDHTMGLYRFVPRAILADEAGTALTLDAGEAREFPVALQSKPAWDAGGIYLVAFVQNPTTKEVLQAEHDIMMPNILADRSVQQIDETVEPMEWIANLSATQSGRYTLDINADLPPGWSFTATIDGAPIISGDSVTLEGGVPRPMRVTIVPSATTPCRVGNLIFILSGRRGYNILVPFTLFSGRIETLLLLRDYSRQDIIGPYINAMEGIGRPYAPLSAYQEGLFELHRHVVVFITGKSALYANDVALLGDVIERGGRLLLTGAEIAYGLADQNNTGEDGAVRDTAFLHNRLHATYLGDDGGTSSVRGVGGDPVGNGALLSIEGGIPDNETPDLIEPRDGAIPIFYYSFADQRIAGIRYEKDGGRMIYLGFTIEGMGKASQRLDLMRRSIEWLTGTSSVDDAPEAAGDLLGTPWPNPASSAITVPIALKAPARARVELYDMRGALAAAMPERTFEAGINTVRIDCSGLPSGGYRVVVSSGGRVATAMVAVMP